MNRRTVSLGHRPTALSYFVFCRPGGGRVGRWGRAQGFTAKPKVCLPGGGWAGVQGGSLVAGDSFSSRRHIPAPQASQSHWVSLLTTAGQRRWPSPARSLCEPVSPQQGGQQNPAFCLRTLKCVTRLHTQGHCPLCQLCINKERHTPGFPVPGLFPGTLSRDVSCSHNQQVGVAGLGALPLEAVLTTWSSCGGWRGVTTVTLLVGGDAALPGRVARARVQRPELLPESIAVHTQWTGRPDPGHLEGGL